MLLTQTIAFCVNPQINASFDYAVRLMELPQGMFGISLATYLLTTLSGLAAEKNYSEFRGTLRQGIGTLLFANVIAAILLVVLAEPIIRLLFERGKFTADSTDRATLALMCLAPGLVAFSTVNILARAFFALGDTKTPMQISIACFAVNLVLSALLVVPLRQGGLGIANTITSVCNAGLLLYALRRKAGETGNGIVARHVSAAGGRRHSGRAGGVVGLVVLGKFSRPPDHRVENWRGVCAGGLAGLIYWLVALAFKIPAAKEMAEFAFAKFKTVGQASSLFLIFILKMETGWTPVLRDSNRHHRRPATFAELRFKFLHQRFGGGFVFGDGKRGGAAAGHQRGQRTVRAEKFLKQREHRIFFQRRGFERIVKFSARNSQIAGLKF